MAGWDKLLQSGTLIYPRWKIAICMCVLNSATTLIFQTLL